MTNQEAIELLGNIKRYISGGGVIDKSTNTALKMAISALQAQETCEDCVSRKAVTDVIRHSEIFSTWYEMDDTDDIVEEVIDEARKQLVDDVNELPSVTPKCPECDDAVSREAAIDAAWNTIPSDWFDILAQKLEALPSTQPEYELVKAEDFAKTMSENTLYTFMAWHCEALELMERQGFVICKKTT